MRRDGSSETIPSKIVTQLSPGDKLVIETAGAGGYGPPSARSDDARRADKANGKLGPNID